MSTIPRGVPLAISGRGPSEDGGAATPVSPVAAVALVAVPPGTRVCFEGGEGLVACVYHNGLHVHTHAGRKHRLSGKRAVQISVRRGTISPARCASRASRATGRRRATVHAYRHTCSISMDISANDDTMEERRKKVEIVAATRAPRVSGDPAENLCCAVIGSRRQAGRQDGTCA